MIKLLIIIILLVVPTAWALNLNEWKYVYNTKENKCDSINQNGLNVLDWFLHIGCVPHTYIYQEKILVIKCRKEIEEPIYALFSRTYNDCFKNLVKQALSL